MKNLAGNTLEFVRKTLDEKRVNLQSLFDKSLPRVSSRIDCSEYIALPILPVLLQTGKKVLSSAVQHRQYVNTYIA